MIFRRCFFSVIFCLILPPFAAADNNQAAALLFKMSTALRELNYSGTFTYEAGGRMDSYRLAHTVDNDKEYEYLQNLNGPETVATQEGFSTNCLSRGDELLRGLTTTARTNLNFADNYQFYFLADERIADRIATVIQLMPNDEYRYGYTIAIDKETYLPLRTLLIDSDLRILERFQFVDISVGPKVRLMGGGLLYRINRDVECGPSSLQPTSAWIARWLPRGFVFTGERQANNGDTMLTFTDGLATFTIFVGHNRDLPMTEKGVRRGATIAYLSAKIWQKQPFRISLVGEVPLATAQAVVSSLEYRAQ